MKTVDGGLYTVGLFDSKDEAEDASIWAVTNNKTDDGWVQWGREIADEAQDKTIDNTP